MSGGGAALPAVAVTSLREVEYDTEEELREVEYDTEEVEDEEDVVPLHPPCKKDELNYIYEKDAEELEVIVQRVVQTAKTLEVGTPIQCCDFNLYTTPYHPPQLLTFPIIIYHLRTLLIRLLNLARPKGIVPSVQRNKLHSTVQIAR